MDRTHPIIFYDGDCGLCHRGVRWVLTRDPAGVFRFASLQGDFARLTLTARGIDPGASDTFHVLIPAGAASATIPHSGPRVLSRSEAVFYVLQNLPTRWRGLACLGYLPRWLTDAAYRLVARHRQRFAKRAAGHCPMPDPKWNDRFISSH